MKGRKAGRRTALARVRLNCRVGKEALRDGGLVGEAGLKFMMYCVFRALEGLADAMEGRDD